MSAIKRYQLYWKIHMKWRLWSWVITCTWRPFVGEKLDTAMQSNNIKDKYTVAIFKKETRSLVIFPLESLEILFFTF